MGMEMIFSKDNIREAAEWFWSAIGNYRVIAFNGGMGAGKTTFIKEICAFRHVTDLVTSPSFSLVNEYRLPDGNSIFHIDLYRLRDEEEARQAGIEEILYSGSFCFVEWPGKAPGIFPDNTLQAYIDLMDNQSRRLKLQDASNPEG
jgi:tRNA threonylcarbamoyladenosine biosynthesis protein TsaE